MSRPVKPVPMCCVSIGYHVELIMPTDKGMKLVDILQSSFVCKKDYEERGYVYRPEDEAPCVEFATVSPKQIRAMTTPRRAGTLLLENDQ
jgi:hypothetical protein